MGNITDANKEYVTLGGTISFDKNRDGHIIEWLKSKRQSHKITDEIEILIKIFFENPEDYVYRAEELAKLTSLGITPAASKFYTGANKKVAEMHEKVDKIYNMCLEMYTLAKFGKSTGLDKKAENVAIAQFLAQKQIKDMCEALGIRDMQVFESNKIPNIEEKADNALEFILTHYDGIVKELVISQQPNVVQISAPAEGATQPTLGVDDIEKGPIIEDKHVDTLAEFNSAAEELGLLNNMDQFGEM